MQPLQMWRIPPAHKVEFGWPACRASAHQPQSIGKGRPIFGASFGRLEIKERPDRLIGFGQAIQQPCGGRRTWTGKEVDGAEAGYPVTQIPRPAPKRKDIFNMRGLEKLKTAEFHEWDIAPSQLTAARSQLLG